MSNAQLIDLLTLALPYVEDCAENDAYKPEPVLKLAARIRAAIDSDAWDYYAFSIGEHLAPAIINGDYTGLDDAEEKQLKKFLADYTAGHWDIEDDSEDYHNCEVSGLYTKVIKMRFNFQKSTRD